MAEPDILSTAAPETRPTTARAGDPFLLAWPRFIVAVVITWIALPYTWARILLCWQGTGEPEWNYARFFCVMMVVTFLLTYRLRQHLAARAGFADEHRYGRWMFPTILAGYLLIGFGLGVVGAGPKSSMLGVFLVLVPSLSWVAFAGWWLFDRRSLVARGATLFTVSALAGAYPAMMHVSSSTGDAQPNITWRWTVEDGVRELEIADTKPAVLEVRAVLSTSAHDFSQYLGPNRTGVITSAALETDWERHPPIEVWRVPIGLGWSGFTCVGDYVITQEQRGENECVVCRNLVKGQEVWCHSDPDRFESGLGGSGPRATPTFYEGLIYTMGAKGRFNCLDATDGNVVWTVDIIHDNDGKVDIFGVSGSPMIWKDFVVVAPTGNANASLVAYDRKSGRRVWQSGHDGASHSSPTTMILDGRELLLLHGKKLLTAFEPENGRIAWSFPWSTVDDHDNNSQPILVAPERNTIVVTTGWGKGAALFTVHAKNSTEWLIEPGWESRQMCTKFTTAVLSGDLIFGFDNGILSAIDINTGKRVVKKGRYGHGQVLLVRSTDNPDLLLVQAEPGEVYLVKADASLEELGKREALSDKTWNVPTLSGSHLLVRNDREAICFRLSMKRVR